MHGQMGPLQLNKQRNVVPERPLPGDHKLVHVNVGGGKYGKKDTAMYGAIETEAGSVQEG